MSEILTQQADQEVLSGVVGSAASSTDQTWSQFVTFMVDQRYYGIDITKVREIKGWSEPTELPSSPHAMCGVLNLRGVIVPIFDLRARFGQGVTQPSEEHVVIIVALGERLIGVLVDAVSDILTLEFNDVLPVPDVDASFSQRFLFGLVAMDDRMVALLKLEELFSLGDEAMSDMSF